MVMTLGRTFENIIDSSTSNTVADAVLKITISCNALIALKALSRAGVIVAIRAASVLGSLVIAILGS